MPRNKVKLSFIIDNYARKNSCKKRKESLKKKLEELCILCDIEACAIIYTPNESEPDLWPNKQGVEKVLDQFTNAPKMEKSKKMFNHNSYIEERISKTEDQLKKQIKDNREKEIANKMSECLNGELSVVNLSLEDLNDIVSAVDHRVSEIENMINLRKSGIPATVPPPDSPPQQPLEVVGGGDTENPHMVAGGVAGGVAADAYVPEPVPVPENPGIFDGLETTEWFPDWTDSLEEYFGSS